MIQDFEPQICLHLQMECATLSVLISDGYRAASALYSYIRSYRARYLKLVVVMANLIGSVGRGLLIQVGYRPSK